MSLTGNSQGVCGRDSSDCALRGETKAQVRNPSHKQEPEWRRIRAEKQASDTQWMQPQPLTSCREFRAE